MNAFFDRWQRKNVGRMLTFLLGVVTAVVAVWLLVQLVHAVAFLQPVLIPLAIAAVLAFLLEPVVRVLCAKTRLSRTVIVLAMLGVVLFTAVTAGIWAVPRIYQSTTNMVRELPDFMKKAEDRLLVIINKTLPATPLAAAPDANGKPDPVKPATATRTTDESTPPTDTPGAPDAGKTGQVDADDVRTWISGQFPKLGEQAPLLLRKGGAMLVSAFGGFMGIFGVLLNLIIIPLYFFFLLTEARNIAKRWADFVPLKDSHFKQEVVSTMNEIHGYLVAFFRGQLIVSSIDAVMVAIGLWFLGLKFAALIGVLVLFLTFIPYLGIVLCYIPAVLIAIVQFGDWQHPLLVIAVMLGVQMLESTIIAPKIVGESTGLHPLTVIISVFVWELVLGGPIGALLAVPLTASLKVIMRRYVWERARASARILPSAEVAPVLRAGDRDRFGDGGPDIKAVPEPVAHPR